MGAKNQKKASKGLRRPRVESEAAAVSVEPASATDLIRGGRDALVELDESIGALRRDVAAIAAELRSMTADAQKDVAAARDQTLAILADLLHAARSDVCRMTETLEAEVRRLDEGSKEAVRRLADQAEVMRLRLQDDDHAAHELFERFTADAAQLHESALDEIATVKDAARRATRIIEDTTDEVSGAGDDAVKTIANAGPEAHWRISQIMNAASQDASAMIDHARLEVEAEVARLLRVLRSRHPQLARDNVATEAPPDAGPTDTATTGLLVLP
jgi:F0F1-type ATP synthase membrane subunit b/b'